MTSNVLDRLSSLLRSSGDDLLRARMKRRLFRPEADREGARGPYDEPWGIFIEGLQQALELHLEDLHERVIRHCEQMGWEAAALYCIDSAGCLLEAVAATDATVPGIVRHRLPSDDSDEELLTYDIEAYTYVTKRAELLGKGQDERFNPYVYTTQGHERFQSRLFIPLLLVLDREDLSMQQERCSWRRQGNVWNAVPASDCHLYSIGTLSVSSETLIEDELLEQTLAFATLHAAPLTYRTSLQGFCRSLLEVLLDASGADEAALHLAREARSMFSSKSGSLLFRSGERVRVVHRTSGEVGAAPRPTGLGAEAIRRGIPLRFSGAELERRNQKLIGEGFSATEVFPLTGAEGRCVGLLYLHYRHDDGELSRGVADLVRLAAHEIDAALRAQRRQLLREHVLSEALRLVDSGSGDLRLRLWAMANFAWNLLGCDDVFIVLGDAPTPERVIEHAGRSLQGRRPATDARGQRNADAAPLYDELRQVLIPTRSNFEESEDARATVPLKWNAEQTAVGVLVVEYRGAGHSFEREERELIEQLSSFFAAGISIVQDPSADPSRPPYRAPLLRAAEKLQRRQEEALLQRPIAVAIGERAPAPA